ncbi:MAG: hypothetical protein FWH12_03570 [Treponema sp.]|nr:hypothetical protein [Treponema sp.]
MSDKVQSPPRSIGTHNESSLHRSLKFQYSGAGKTETLAGAYVCDACTSDGELIEVQTSSFGPLKKKVRALCEEHRLRIIHPIILHTYIELYNLDGTLMHRRRSPKKGKTWDLFRALIYAPELPALENLRIELPHVEVTERRINDGKGSWRRKGVRIQDRVLETWSHSLILGGLEDYLQFIPFKKKEAFTALDLSEKAGIDRDLAQKTLYTLTKMGLIKNTGKQGRSFLYKRT